jgi:hypothetical protein
MAWKGKCQDGDETDLEIESLLPRLEEELVSGFELSNASQRCFFSQPILWHLHEMDGEISRGGWALVYS